MRQLSFASLDHQGEKKQKKRKRFLAEMERLMPWAQLLIAEPNPKGPPSSLVRTHNAVWTGDTRDTRPNPDIRVPGLNRVVIYRGCALAYMRSLMRVVFGAEIRGRQARVIFERA